MFDEQMSTWKAMHTSILYCTLKQRTGEKIKESNE